MGYRDGEFPNPLDLFSGANEAVNNWDAVLQDRIRLGDGRPLMRLEQLTTLDEELNEEPRLRLEYDRFSPGLRATCRRLSLPGQI